MGALLRQLVFSFKLYYGLKFFTNGKTINHLLAKLIPLPNKFQNPTIVSKNFKGFKVLCNLSDLMDWSFYFGLKDTGTTFLVNQAKNCKQIIDVGAHKGFLALEILAQNPSISNYYAIEANPSTFSFLLKHQQLNRLKQLNCLNKGIGDKPENWFIQRRATHNSGMDQLVSKPSSNAQKIELVTLDELVSTQNMKPDLIKIDTEGFELKVLKGAEKTIKTFKPKLFIEIDKNNLIQNDTSAETVLDWIFSHQYKVLHVQNQTQIKKGQQVQSNHFDIFCEP